MATIKQAAEALGVPAKRLLNELKKKFPDQTWTVDSDLPDGFEEAVQEHSQEYAEASGVQLPKGELTTSESAVLDTRLILESIEYGVVEAISQLRSAELIESAQLNAVADIQAYESTYVGVWTHIIARKSKIHSNTELPAINRKRKS